MTLHRCSLSPGTASLLREDVGRERVRLAFDLMKQFGAVPLKELVSEDDFLEGAALLVEVVHVELPLERVVVAVLVVPGQHVLLEHLARLDLEGVTVF